MAASPSVPTTFARQKAELKRVALSALTVNVSGFVARWLFIVTLTTARWRSIRTP